MPPKDRSKAAGVSASSFFDLKAELTKREDDFARNKGSVKSLGPVFAGEKKARPLLATSTKHNLTVYSNDA
jgi:hypothetical protein